MENLEKDKIDYPFIVFNVAKTQFCVNSKHISSIMQLPEYESLPSSPQEIMGIFSYRGGHVTMLDLRSLLKKKTMEEEYREFCEMIDQRKQEHVRWVEELERTALSGETFTLATDSHKCALGKWYYAFRSDVLEVNFHLKKIEEPHDKLHNAAIDVANCSRECDACKREECLKQILDRVKGDCMPRILTLLEETKELFRNKVYHEMVLVMDGEPKIGLVVDSVDSVEDLKSVKKEGDNRELPLTQYIKDMKKSDKTDDIILELNIERVLQGLDRNYISGINA